MSTLAIGIDLGTSNSCAAVFKNGKVEIIQSEEGAYIFPSWVSFTNNGIITGYQAKDEAYKNVPNTIFDVKRLMGQYYSDQKVQTDIERLPYKIIDNKGLAKIQISYNDKEEQYSPEEISAFILEKLKRQAEAYLGQNVTSVVVTVPAYFNDFQRQATKDAATIAGFQQINIINEPTAAALAFSYQNMKPYKRNILVYDFGGGTFDVSIVTVEKGNCEVKATQGDIHLGGVDINANLVDFIRKDFKKRYGEDIVEDEATRRRMQVRCEKVKEQLSGRMMVDLELDNLSDRDYKKRISRLEFEQLNMELFKNTLDIVRRCLQSSGFSKDEIDEIVLVGGSSRIPKVQKMIESIFGEDKINKGVNPDEAVAYGAAIYASNLSEDTTEDKSVIKDVISLSLGIAVVNPKKRDEFLSNKIVPHNTPIPTKFTKRYLNSYDNQDSVAIIVHQGEGELAADNFELGSFIFSGITKAPIGTTKLDVCFEVDAEGILKVTASEVGSVNMKQIEISARKKGLTSQQITKRTAEMEDHRREEMGRKEFVAAKYKAEILCETIIDKANNVKETDIKNTILNKCNSLSIRLQNISLQSQDELHDINNELQDIFSII